MIENLIRDLGPWTWWIIGFLFLIIEIFAPGMFFLWIGLAALIVGTNALFIPMAWQAQVVLFAVLSIVLAVLGRKLFHNYGKTSEREDLNKASERYVGRSYTLADDLSNGEGRLKIGDTFWLVRATKDYVAGTKVTVTGYDGSVLLIEEASEAA
ncbi:MAG: NfeD family protein [Pseudomonadota bacterium]